MSNVVKSGCDENRLTKQNHSTTLLNTDRQTRWTIKENTYIHRYI